MKTLVVGGSTNPERYSFKAIAMLREYEHEVLAIALRNGTVADVEMQTQEEFEKDLPEIDTVTLYVSEKNQAPYFELIAKLKPRRVIFNPGTENPDFEEALTKQGVIAERACTLVLLSTGQF